MTRYDVAIVGAGVIGASIAFHLAERGVRRVALVERGQVASGNTAKSGAIVRMHYSNMSETALALPSLSYFRDWKQRVGGDCGFTQSGFAIVVGPNNLERLRRRVARLRSWGVDVELLEPRQLAEIQPGLAIDDLAAAAYEKVGGYADPIAATRSLVDRAVDMGVDLSTDTSVRSIDIVGGRAAGLSTSAGPLAADVVVCAANTWSPRLLATAGVELPVIPRRAQIGFYSRPSVPANQMVLIDLAVGTWSRDEGDGETLAGLAWLTGNHPSDPDELIETVDPDFIDAAREGVAKRMPGLASSRFTRGHAGMYDMSPDTRAILGAVPSVEGLHVAAGFSGTGFKKAPAVGACLAELITTGATSTADIRAFRFSRFAEGAPIAGQDEYELPGDWGHAF